MRIPIVMAAFGTTTKALNTYSFMDEICKKHFPDYEIIWAYSSRMVKDWIKKRKGIDLKHPHQVLEELEKKGHPWTVIQSVHLISGHEFYRLVKESQSCAIRSSIGLPLLTSYEDYQKTASAISNNFNEKTDLIKEDEAVVIIGHGTDHFIWSAYPAFQQVLQEKLSSKVFVGMIEHGYPSREEIIKTVKKEGFKKVRFIPFMLVAGVHFYEDLAGDEDSWKVAFEEEGISVEIEKNGIGFYPEIVDIFCRHIQDALDVIPA
ncbi:sirohydrochlorin cobaltochelatase [Candidatus Magnetomoraceae bacterium gMMP-15]